MIATLMSETEVFIKHESFSSNPGGYSIMVNGIIIHTKEVKLYRVSLIKKFLIESFMEHPVVCYILDCSAIVNLRRIIQKPWDSKSNLIDILDQFENYANATNNPCDAEMDSFDAMMLLTGRANTILRPGIFCNRIREKIFTGIS